MRFVVYSFELDQGLLLQHQLDLDSVSASRFLTTLE